MSYPPTIRSQADLEGVVDAQELRFEVNSGEHVMVSRTHVTYDSELTVVSGSVSIAVSSDTFIHVIVRGDAHTYISGAYEVDVRDNGEASLSNVTNTTASDRATVTGVGDVEVVRLIDNAQGHFVHGVDKLYVRDDAVAAADTVQTVELGENGYLRARSIDNLWMCGNSMVVAERVGFGTVCVSACALVARGGYLKALDNAGVVADGVTLVDAFNRSDVMVLGKACARKYDSTARLRVYQTALGIACIVPEVVDRVELPCRKSTQYKVTNGDGTTGIEYGHPTSWVVGQRVTAEDWVPNDKCGNGLHVSPIPAYAMNYHDGLSRPRIFEVGVNADVLYPIDHTKSKVEYADVLREVDLVGRPLPV